MKNKNKAGKIDKVLDTINTASSLLTLTEISKVPLEYSSLRHPELLETYEKTSIHAIRKKMLGLEGNTIIFHYVKTPRQGVLKGDPP